MSARPRHVLHVLNGASGGAAQSTLTLVRLLREEGIASSAVCHAMGSAADREAIRDALEGRVLFTPLYWWNRKIRAKRWKRPAIELLQIVQTRALAGSTSAVAAFATRVGTDLVHTNTMLTPEGGLAARWLGLPHVWHLRELVGKGEPFRFYAEGRPFGWVVEQLASVVVANSDAAGKRIRPWLSTPPTVIPNAVDVEAFSGIDSRARAAGPMRIGMVANLTSRVKEHALALEALHRMRHDATLIMIGECPPAGSDGYVDSLRDLVGRLGLARRVTFAGVRSDMVSALRDIDVLLHPARAESFGRVAVEAMAAGRPVVGVAAGGVGEVVVDEETGLLVRPGDSGAMAHGLDRLAEDAALRARLGRAGRLRAQRRYSLGVLAAAMLKLYGDAMRKSLRRPAAPDRRGRDSMVSAS